MALAKFLRLLSLTNLPVKVGEEQKNGLSALQAPNLEQFRAILRGRFFMNFFYWLLQFLMRGVLTPKPSVAIPPNAYRTFAKTLFSSHKNKFVSVF